MNFYDDNGALTATALNNATSITGVRIVAGPNFPDWKGNEFNQFRRFTFSAEAEYPATNSANLLISFKERLTFSGGGPEYVWKKALFGLPQKQRTCAFSVFKAMQEGEAVGYLKYPTAPRPLWPSALIHSPDQTLASPMRKGGIVPHYDTYPTTWRYEFQAATQFTGLPNLWLG